MLPIVLFSVVAILLYLYLTHKLSYWKNRNVPHRKPNLIFGNLTPLLFRSELPSKYFQDLYDEFNEPYFGFYCSFRPWLVIKDPKIIKRILLKDNHVFSNRFDAFDEKIDPISFNTLVGMRTPHWKFLRTKLTPVFTTAKIKSMLDLMLNCGNDLKNYVNARVNKSVEVKEIAVKYTIDLITSYAFGVQGNCFVQENSKFRVAGRKLFHRSFSRAVAVVSYFFIPALVKILRLKFINPEAAQFVREFIEEAIRNREDTKKKRNDLIDILVDLKNAEPIADERKFYGDRLAAQGVVFFGAGYDTTSSLISFTLYEMCLNQDIQERLRQEINGTIKNHNGQLTYEGVQEMQYLHMIICESLRKYPLIPFIIRYGEEDYTIPETGLVIEKDVPILVSQHGLTWDSKYFPNPEVYDPERFSPKNREALTNCVYMPFGMGPRNCIAERFALISSKIAIIHFVKNFQIEKNADTQELLTFSQSGLLQAVPGVYLTFKNLPEN